MSTTFSSYGVTSIPNTFVGFFGPMYRWICFCKDIFFFLSNLFQELLICQNWSLAQRRLKIPQKCLVLLVVIQNWALKTVECRLHIALFCEFCCPSVFQLFYYCFLFALLEFQHTKWISMAIKGTLVEHLYLNWSILYASHYLLLKSLCQYKVFLPNLLFKGET